MTGMALATRGRHGRAELVHEGLFYAGAEEYLDGCVPFVLEGLALDEPVLVAVPAENLERLRSALGEAAERVRFADMTRAGRNPGRIIPAVLQAFVDEHRGGRVRIIGEPIWDGRSEDEYPACVQHEALINVALGDRSAAILCPYDLEHLAARALDDATRTHPILLRGDGERYESEGYDDPVEVARVYNLPLREPEQLGDTLIFDATSGTRAVRRFLRQQAERAGLGPERITDLCTAANEVVVNTIVHTGKPGILAVWREEDAVVCEVQDSGRLTDPLAGRRAPEATDGRGYGLFLVNDLCDLVRIHTDDRGTTVRMSMLLGRP